jgi:GNAT superfamily N-acetyltransferase
LPAAASPERRQAGGKKRELDLEARSMARYEIKFAENPAEADLQILDEGIDEDVEMLFGSSKNIPLTFFLRDEMDLVVGGVHGNYSKFGWLYISTLWVSEKVRGRDYGTQLMQHIEQAAVKAGCSHAYLDTFSFQAPAFYEKLGYTRFGKLEDFPAGQSKIFFRKRLTLPANKDGG